MSEDLLDNDEELDVYPLPDWWVESLSDEDEDLIEKARTHKYISKEPDHKGGWRYKYEEAKNKLTKQDEDIIIDYCEFLHSELNSELRKPAGVKSLEKKAEQLSQALGKLPNYTGLVTRFQPLTENQISGILSKIGESITFKAFTSTSKIEDVSKKKSTDVVLKIESKTGKDISGISSRSEEQEVLFDKMTSFKIKSFDGKVLHLEEINKLEEDRYESIRVSAKQVISGERKLKRLSQAEELGRITGGIRAVEATLLLRGSEGSGGEVTKDDARRQEEILIKYAEDHDLMMDVNGDPKYEYISSGAESRVYYNSSESMTDEDFASYPGYVVKVVDYTAFSRTPLEYLDDRVALHNFLFPEAAYEVIGFHKNFNDFKFIVRQPFVHGEPVSSQELIEEMAKRGFENPTPRLFLNSDYVVDDLHSGNMVKTAKGNIVVFDPIVCLRTEEDEGNRVYNNIEIE